MIIHIQETVTNMSGVKFYINLAEHIENTNKI